MKSNKYKKKTHRNRSSLSNNKLKRTSSCGNSGFNYLVFCWNLASNNVSVPVCVTNGHGDIVYDMTIETHDQCLMYIGINGFEYKQSDTNDIDYVFSKKLFFDDSKYVLQALLYNNKTNDFIFGNRK